MSADPTDAIRAAERELNRLRRRRADLETGRGTYANHPVNRAVIAHEQAEANVRRLQGNLTSGRMPRRRAEDEGGGAGAVAPTAGSVDQTLDDLRTPELKRIDGAEGKVTSRLASLKEAQQQRADFYATHPEVARRLDRIDSEVQALDVVVEGPTRGAHLERGRMVDPPWMRNVLNAERSLDIGLGL